MNNTNPPADLVEELKAWREVAEKATPGPWRCEEGSTSYPECDDRDFWAAVLSPYGREIVTLHERYSLKADDRRDYDFDAAHIATFDPPTVIRLLALLQTSEAKSLSQAADNERLRGALELILPLAKGYAPEGQTDTAKRTCRSWIEVAEAALSLTPGDQGVSASRDRSPPATAATPKSAATWRCKKCGCHSHARVDESVIENGQHAGFRPSKYVRCIECKDVSPFPLVADQQLGGTEQ